jgi:hypothetical protein
MAANELGLKHLPLELLEVGDSVLIGPYKEAKTATGKWCQIKRDNPDLAARSVKQRQFILIDPVTCEAFKMYLVTRTE